MQIKRCTEKKLDAGLFVLAQKAFCRSYTLQKYYLFSQRRVKERMSFGVWVEIFSDFKHAP